MKSALILPSDSELREIDWTLPRLERLWETIESHAANCSQFRRKWRVESEYKVFREELYSLLWFMRHMDVLDETTVRLMPAGDAWDAQMKRLNEPILNIQITRAYQKTSLSQRNAGYADALRMKLLNEAGVAPAFGTISIYSEGRSKSIRTERAAVERRKLISSYVDGINTALANKKHFAMDGKGDLIVHIADWLRILGEEGFVSVVSSVNLEVVDVHFDRVHIFADALSCYRAFSYDRHARRLLLLNSTSRDERIAGLDAD
jgi:hypothetical protein